MSLTRCANGHMFSSRRHGSVCPYCNVVVEQFSKPNSQPTMGVEEDDKTMPYFGEVEGIDPVTGWLICIEGPQMGRDYRILSEKTLLEEQKKCIFGLLGITLFQNETTLSLSMIIKKEFLHAAR